MVCDASGNWVETRSCLDSGLVCDCPAGGAPCDCLNCDDPDLRDPDSERCGGNTTLLCTGGYWIPGADCEAGGQVCRFGECIDGEGITGAWELVGTFHEVAGQTACEFPSEGVSFDLERAITESAGAFSIDHSPGYGGDDPLVITDGTVSGTRYSAAGSITMDDPAVCEYGIDFVFEAELIGGRLIGEWGLTFSSATGPECPTEQQGTDPWPIGCVTAFQFEGDRM